MTELWTPAWAEQQATPRADVVELWSVELFHPAFVDELMNGTSIRCVSDNQDQMLPLEDSALRDPGQTVLFKAVPFEVPWPDAQEGQTPQVRIRIDNVGRELAPYLDAAVLVNAPVTIIFRCHLWSNGGASIVAAINPVTLVLRQVTVSEQFVEGTASPADLANLQFLRVIYDVQNYPALTQQ